MIYQVQQLAGRKWWPIRTFDNIEDAERFARSLGHARVIWLNCDWPNA